jgi:hypothetical protein
VSASTIPQPDEFAERSAKIQQLHAEALLKLFDVLKRDQDIRFAPFTMLLTGFGTAAAVIGATVALVKLLSL